MRLFLGSGLIMICFCMIMITKGVSQVFNNGFITINPNENVYIQGDYYNQNNGRMTLSGIIHLKGNWTNYNPSANIITNSNGGLLKLIGQTQQKIGGTQSTKFNNVELINNQGVALFAEAEIRQSFTFIKGKVFTNNNFLNISTSDNNAIIGHDINKYVVGNLRRYIAGYSPYDLPVGTASYYELANIKFYNLAGIQYVNSFFVQEAIPPPQSYPSPNAVYVYPDVMNPIANPLSNYMSRYSYIAEFLNYGYWVVAPDNISSADFKMTLTERGHTNGGQIPGQHALIRRDNEGDLWRAQGFYPSNSQVGNGNNPITVYMTSMTGFSHFIIGKSRDEFGPLAIELLSFDLNCENHRVRITWTTENESNNNYFTIEKSLDLINWVEVAKVAGQLFSNGVITYEIFDISPWNGTSYYRLKQKDLSGIETIFDEQWLRFVKCSDNPDNWISCFINSDRQIEVNFETNVRSSYRASVYDPLGRLLAKCNGTAEFGNNYLTINVVLNSLNVILLDFQCDNRKFKQKFVLPAY